MFPEEGKELFREMEKMGEKLKNRSGYLSRDYSWDLRLLMEITTAAIPLPRAIPAIVHRGMLCSATPIAAPMIPPSTMPM
jgi:hypothetical protein